jgi:hypothetical protein
MLIFDPVNHEPKDHWSLPCLSIPVIARSTEIQFVKYFAAGDS